MLDIKTYKLNDETNAGFNTEIIRDPNMTTIRSPNQSFLNILENIDMSRPRNVDFFTHSDRFYLSARLSFMDKAIKEIKNIKRHQQIQKRIAGIKLVRINNK